MLFFFYSKTVFTRRNDSLKTKFPSAIMFAITNYNKSFFKRTRKPLCLVIVYKLKRRKTSLRIFSEISRCFAAVRLILTLHYRKRFDDTGYVSEYFIAFKFDHNHKSYCNISHKEISPLKDYFTQLPGGKEAKTLYWGWKKQYWTDFFIFIHEFRKRIIITTSEEHK